MLVILSKEIGAYQKRDLIFELAGEPEISDFEGIATEDGSWFQNHYQPREMFVAARQNMIPSLRIQLEIPKVMIAVFFTSRMKTVLELLWKGSKLDQDFFINTVLTRLPKDR
jgi:hypothetical protein